MKKTSVYLLSLFLLFGITTAGLVKAEPTPYSYFPLEIGNSWLYSIKTNGQTVQMEYSASGRQTVNGQTTVVVESKVNGTNPQTEYYDANALGVFTVMRNLGNYRFKFSPNQIFLKYPVTIGDSWSQKGNFSDPAQNVSFQYEQQCQYLAVESVTVPAGTFQAVKLQLALDISDGSQVAGFRYFAPGVGLIKEALQLTMNHRTFAIDSELIRFKPGTAQPETK